MPFGSSGAFHSTRILFEDRDRPSKFVTGDEAKKYKYLLNYWYRTYKETKNYTSKLMQRALPSSAVKNETSSE